MESLIRYDSGTRFTATCGDYTVATGRGEDGNPERDGMYPAQLFAASVGMCIGGYVAAYCKHHDIPHEGMTISIDRETAKAPSRTTRLTAEIKLDAQLSGKDAKAILHVADRCHITNSIRESMEVVCSLAGRDEE
jgi:uncharacterized OsmC-like protein